MPKIAIMSIITLASRYRINAFEAKGEKSALRPTTRVRFAVQLPSILPIAKSPLPTTIENELDTISGNEVPIATSVRPMRSSE